jgi:hypothetical protein
MSALSSYSAPDAAAMEIARGEDDPGAPSGWRRPRCNPQAWRPRNIPVVSNGFDTTIGVEDLHEGCRRLGVTASGDPLLSYTRKAIGTVAVAPDGTRSWVKISALHGTPSHWQRECELSSIVVGVPRPALIAHHAWAADHRQWLALQTTLSKSPAVEHSHWAGSRAARLGHSWIVQLRAALAAVAGLRTQRRLVTPDEVGQTIRRQFGPHVPQAADRWTVAHGDLSWSNVTAPDLELLDWESWGLAPHGFDAAKLVAFSCASPSLVTRLERAFADVLATPSGKVAQLFILANILEQMENGWLNPYYRDGIEAMARRVVEGV